MDEMTQLAYWVHGIPIHAPGRHTPDQACCVPKKLADYKTRVVFYSAYRGRDQKLMRELIREMRPLEWVD